MTGTEFIALASKLTANPALGDAEARFRSAASRAYYGAFHLARLFLLELGSHVVKNATGHTEAYRLLWSSRQPDAQTAARLLTTLRSERNRADYNLDDPRFREQRTAIQAVEMAHEVRKLLDRCRQEPALSEIRSRLSGS